MNKTIIALLLVAVLAFACTPPGNDGDPKVTTTGTYTPVSAFNPDAAVQPTSFKSEEEFAAFISGAGASSYGGVGFERYAVLTASAPTASADSAKSYAESGGSGNSFSGTNNQVAAVDEADIIKTDGKYIYTVTGNTLFIVKAGDDAEVVETIEFDQQPSGIFIDGDSLVVFGNFYDIDYFKEIGFVPRRGGMTFFDVYDISDIENPELLKEYKFEGAYFQSRMHDDTIYFVVTVWPEGRRDYPTPIIVDGTTVRSMPVTDIYHFPVPYSEVQLATVHAIDMNDLSKVSSKAVAVEWNNQLYMSEENIYITHTETINEWEIRQEIIQELIEPQLTSDDKDLIARIKDADDEVLSQAEKRQKIYAIYSSYYDYMGSERADFDKQVDERLKEELEQYDAMSYTIINRISIPDLDVAATGKVPGSLNNQFAMDEHEGYLRVATTIQPSWGGWWGRPMPVDTVAVEAAVESDAPTSAKVAVMPRDRTTSTNNVYVLDMSMDIVGELKDLAEGEQIYSTRFMGDRLYMVTFRQVDPFFAVDLSDPRNPEVLGELKIPGFSRYLHPYDENIIIGIGRDATDMGQQQGLKISLFDVTNPEKPRELAKWVADEQYSQSAAEYEHKAFLFDKEKELLVIPAYSYDYDYRSGSRQNYNGAMVFRITADDIEMRGIIDHSSGTGEQYYYGPSVERSLWIDDLLYTKSPNLIRVNELDDLQGVANVTLSSKAGGPYPVY
jgi:inhibitor of cysteine peptidase